MRHAVIVIGCSYGDEGKGLAAAWSAGRMKAPVLNVLINGGAQRGHTVDLPDGRRHVFHHFGSAALRGAVSCADEDFLVNPLLYVQELKELEKDFGLRPELVISERCRVTTPWDMITGQIIEAARGKYRHGSCGCGINETLVRYRETDWALRWGQLREMRKEDWQAYCRRIMEDYLPERLERMHAPADGEWQTVIRNRDLMEAAWLDLQEMQANTASFGGWKQLAEDYPSLLFEAGQGLALDAENKTDFPHLTPSRTTSLISAKRIAALPGKTDTEIRYVTRSYLTRHGAGPFPTECPKERIGKGLRDRTNVPNPHQQTLRYGTFDGGAVMKRVRADLEATRAVLPGAVPAVLVTHLNETGGRLKGNLSLEELTAQFDRVAVSDCPWDAVVIKG
ncbi:MAG: adenylosuccinate synthetase [Clostridia bacterium]|nr:adenylosuccinate synthetase [Clostridia bacterium]